MPICATVCQRTGCRRKAFGTVTRRTVIGVSARRSRDSLRTVPTCRADDDGTLRRCSRSRWRGRGRGDGRRGRLQTAINGAHRGAVSLRNLSPAHALRALLQHAREGHYLAIRGRDCAAVERCLQVGGGRVIDAGLTQGELRERERMRDIPPAHRLGRNRKRSCCLCGFAR